MTISALAVRPVKKFSELTRVHAEKVAMMNFIPSSPAARDSYGKKGTKLRATCDACKDAKVRCNRDVPTCYRCRNQKLKCVYNLSRRMGRPRRNKSDVDSGALGAEDEQDKEQGQNNCDEGGRKDKTATADSATLLGNSRAEQAQDSGNRPSIIDSTDHNGHYTGSNSSDAGTQNSSTISSLLDPFGSPDEYDLNQFHTPTGMSDFDKLAEIDFFNGPSPGPSIPSGSAIPSSFRMSHWMRPQATSTLDGVSIREQSNTSRSVAASLSSPSADTLPDGNMMLIDGLEERPLSSLEDTFDLEQRYARDNSGQRTPSAVGRHGEIRAAPSQSAMCECYQTILQKLADIDENQSKNFSSAIDVALMLEQRVQGHIAKVLECGTCATKRPTILLLLAIVIDNVVCMFEKSARFANSRSPVENNNCNDWSNTQYRSTVPTSFRTPQVADMTGAGKSAASPATRTATDKPPLLVGSHEILSEEKNKFLKLLLQGRLSSLLITLRQLMPYMQRSSPQSSSSRHGTTIMAETYKRLQSIIGRVELWDG